jgi:hypothetical protein
VITGSSECGFYNNETGTLKCGSLKVESVNNIATRLNHHYTIDVIHVSYRDLRKPLHTFKWSLLDFHLHLAIILFLIGAYTKRSQWTSKSYNTNVLDKE